MKCCECRLTCASSNMSVGHTMGLYMEHMPPAPSGFHPFLFITTILLLYTLSEPS